MVTKVLPFITNYRRELRIGADIRRKEKVEKVIEFVERIKKVQEKAQITLKKVQKDIKRQADRGKQEVEEWKKRDKIILSMKDLVFKERLVKKLMERHIGLYEIKEVVSKNAVKLRLLASIRIYPVVNVSRVIRYRKPVRGQKKKEPKLVKIDEVKE